MIATNRNQSPPSEITEARNRRRKSRLRRKQGEAGSDPVRAAPGVRRLRVCAFGHGWALRLSGGPSREEVAVLERITWFRQSALRWVDDERTIYIDPWGTPEDAPPADLILITHAHDDHFQPEEIERLRATWNGAGGAPRCRRRTHRRRHGGARPARRTRSPACAFTTVPAYNTREEALRVPSPGERLGGVRPGARRRHVLPRGRHRPAPELDDDRRGCRVPADRRATTRWTWRRPRVWRWRSTPRLAVPMHYGFVVGSATDGDRFREAAAPVAVDLMDPTNPFEC